MSKSTLFIACAAVVTTLMLTTQAMAGAGGGPASDGLGRQEPNSATNNVLVTDPLRDGTLTYSLVGANGSATSDTIVVGDWDGDGDFDPAIVRPNGANLLWILFTNGGPVYQLFGLAGDTPVPGNWDPSDAAWELGTTRANGPSLLWLTETAGGGVTRTLFGNASDVPVPGNWDGSAGTDQGVTRPNNANKLWITRANGGGVDRTLFGAAADTEYAGDFTGDGNANFGVRISGDNVFRLDLGGSLEYVQFGNTTSDLVNPRTLGQ